MPDRITPDMIRAITGAGSNPNSQDMTMPVSQQPDADGFIMPPRPVQRTLAPIAQPAEYQLTMDDINEITARNLRASYEKEVADEEARKLAAEQKKPEQAARYGGRYGQALVRGLENTAAAAGGLAAIGGELTNIEPLKKAGVKTYQYFQDKAAEIPGAEFKDIQGVGSALTWTLEKAIENAPFLIGTGVGGAAGKQVISRVIPKVTGNMLEKMAIKKVGKDASAEIIGLTANRIAKSLGTKAGMIGTVAAVESGGDYADMVERGLGSDSAALTTLATGVGKGFVEMMGGPQRYIGKWLGTETGTVFNRSVNAIKTALNKGAVPGPEHYNIIRRILGESLRIGSEEGFEEVIQEGMALANIGIHDPNFKVFTAENLPRILEAGVGGFAVGALLGMPGGAFTSPERYVQDRGYVPPQEPLAPATGDGITPITPPTAPTEPDKYKVKGGSENLLAAMIDVQHPMSQEHADAIAGIAPIRKESPQNEKFQDAAITFLDTNPDTGANLVGNFVKAIKVNYDAKNPNPEWLNEGSAFWNHAVDVAQYVTDKQSDIANQLIALDAVKPDKDFKANADAYNTQFGTSINNAMDAGKLRLELTNEQKRWANWNSPLGQYKKLREEIIARLGEQDIAADATGTSEVTQQGLDFERTPQEPVQIPQAAPVENIAAIAPPEAPVVETPEVAPPVTPEIPSEVPSAPMIPSEVVPIPANIPVRENVPIQETPAAPVVPEISIPEGIKAVTARAINANIQNTQDANQVFKKYPKIFDISDPRMRYARTVAEAKYGAIMPNMIPTKVPKERKIKDGKIRYSGGPIPEEWLEHFPAIASLAGMGAISKQGGFTIEEAAQRNRYNVYQHSKTQRTLVDGGRGVTKQAAKKLIRDIINNSPVLSTRHGGKENIYIGELEPYMNLKIKSRKGLPSYLVDRNITDTGYEDVTAERYREAANDWAGTAAYGTGGVVGWNEFRQKLDNELSELNNAEGLTLDEVLKVRDGMTHPAVEKAQEEEARDIQASEWQDMGLNDDEIAQAFAIENSDKRDEYVDGIEHERRYARYGNVGKAQPISDIDRAKFQDELFPDNAISAIERGMVTAKDVAGYLDRQSAGERIQEDDNIEKIINQKHTVEPPTPVSPAEPVYTEIEGKRVKVEPSTALLDGTDIRGVDYKAGDKVWIRSDTRETLSDETYQKITEGAQQANIPIEAKVTEKQPWEMSQTEYVVSRKKKTLQENNEVKVTHKSSVEQALSENKKVPKKVLADYPDLQAKYFPQKPPESTLNVEDKQTSMMDGLTKATDMFEEQKPTAPENNIIPNSKDLDIRNLDAMPRGTGARYLLAIKGEGNSYIAKQWKRVVPTTFAPNEVLIDFEGEGPKYAINENKEGVENGRVGDMPVAKNAGTKETQRAKKQDSREERSDLYGRRDISTGRPEQATRGLLAGAVKPQDAGITAADIKQMFPGAVVNQLPNGAFSITKNGNSVAVEVVESITPDEVQFELGYGYKYNPAEKRISGSYYKGRIKVIRTGNKWHLAHEEYHWLKDIGIINKLDITALNHAIAIKNKIKASEVTEEQQATYIENGLKNRELERNSVLKRMLQKIQDFIDGLVNLVHRTARGVLRGIETGKILERGGKTGKGAEQYQVEAFHGTGNVWQGNKASLAKVGTGQGAASFGFGLYFTSEKDIAKHYADTLGRGQVVRFGPYNLTSERMVADSNLIRELVKLLNSAEAYGENKTDINKGNLRIRALEVMKKIDSMWGGEPVSSREHYNHTYEMAKFIRENPEKIEYTPPQHHIYKVTLHKGKQPSEYDYLEWDQELSQSIIDKVESQLIKENPASNKRRTVDLLEKELGRWENFSGRDLYSFLSDEMGSDKEASLFLLRAGIDGIKYPAGTLSGIKYRVLHSDISNIWWLEKNNERVFSDGKTYPASHKGELLSFKTEQEAHKWIQENQSYNYVVFDENAITIEDVEKYATEEKFMTPSGETKYATTPLDPNAVGDEVEEDIDKYGPKYYKNVVKMFGAFFASKEFKDDWSPGMKQDVSRLMKVISLPMHYTKKVLGLHRAWQQWLDLPDIKHKFENAMFRGYDENENGIKYLEVIDAYYKKFKEESKRFKKYIFLRDRDQIKWSVVKTGKKGQPVVFEVRNPQGVVMNTFTVAEPANLTAAQLDRQRKGGYGLGHGMTIAEYETQERAWEDAYQREASATGWSQEGKSALIAYRTVADQELEFQLSGAQDALDALESSGKKVPLVPVGRDKDGKRIEIDLRTAIMQMGQLRGAYMPRLRTQGDWSLYARKDGENPRLEFFNSKKVMQARARELKENGFSVTLDASKALGNEVFSRIQSTAAIQDFVQSAIDRMTDKIPDSALGVDKYKSHAEAQPGSNYQTLYVSGVFDAAQKDILKSYRKKPDITENDDGTQTWKFVDSTSGTIEQITKDFLQYKNITADAHMEFARVLVDDIAETIRNRSSLARRTHRTEAMGKDVVLGYEQDPLLAITMAGKGIASSAAKHKVALGMYRAKLGTDEYTWKEWQEKESMAGRKPDWAEYRDHVNERRIDPKQKEALAEWQSMFNELLRTQDSLDNFMGTIRGVASLMYLWGRAPAAFINLTTLGTSLPAAISGRSGIGIGRAFSLIAQQANAWRAWVTWKEGAPKSPAFIESALLFQEIYDRGWHEAQFNKEAVSVLKNRLGRSWDTMIDTGMWMFGKAEEINRATSIAAAYKALKEQAGIEGDDINDELLLKAKSISDDANGVYTQANMPSWARGSGVFANAARAFYVFRTYTHTYLVTMMDMLMQGGAFNQKGWTGENANAKRAALYMALAGAIFGGTGSSVLVAAILMGLKAARKDDPEEELYAWINNTFGDYPEQIARYGLAGAFGVNIKGSLQIHIGDVPSNIFELLGAPGSIVTEKAQGINDLFHGKKWKGTERILPYALSAPMKAIREYNTGVTSKSNAPLFFGDEPVRLETLEAALRALSFQPARTSAIREKQWSERVITKKFADERYNIYDTIRAFWIKPPEKRTKNEWMKILVSIEKYNNEARRADTTLITRSNINSARKGTMHPPKKERIRAQQMKLENKK